MSPLWDQVGHQSDSITFRTACPRWVPRYLRWNLLMGQKKKKTWRVLLQLSSSVQLKRQNSFRRNALLCKVFLCLEYHLVTARCHWMSHSGYLKQTEHTRMCLELTLIHHTAYSITQTCACMRVRALAYFWDWRHIAEARCVLVRTMCGGTCRCSVLEIPSTNFFKKVPLRFFPTSVHGFLASHCGVWIKRKISRTLSSKESLEFILNVSRPCKSSVWLNVYLPSTPALMTAYIPGSGAHEAVPRKNVAVLTLAANGDRGGGNHFLVCGVHLPVLPVVAAASSLGCGREERPKKTRGGSRAERLQSCLCPSQRSCWPTSSAAQSASSSSPTPWSCPADTTTAEDASRWRPTPPSRSTARPLSAPNAAWSSTTWRPCRGTSSSATSLRGSRPARLDHARTARWSCRTTRRFCATTASMRRRRPPRPAWSARCRCAPGTSRGTRRRRRSGRTAWWTREATEPLAAAPPTIAPWSISAPPTWTCCAPRASSRVVTRTTTCSPSEWPRRRWGMRWRAAPRFFAFLCFSRAVAHRFHEGCAFPFGALHFDKMSLVTDHRLVVSYVSVKKIAQPKVWRWCDFFSFSFAFQRGFKIRYFYQ